MRLQCICGETLSNSMAPNDIQLRVYTDKEWDDIINMGEIDSINIPDPKYDVWRCPKCERIYVFEDFIEKAIKSINSKKINKIKKSHTVLADIHVMETILLPTAGTMCSTTISGAWSKSPGSFVSPQRR